MNNTSIKLWILLTALFSCISVKAYDFESDGLYFDLTSLPNRTCTLTSGNTAYAGSLIIPESVNYEGLVFTVTEIASKAFINSNITELSIPSSINTIPSSITSYCKKLVKLTFKDGQTPIEGDVNLGVLPLQYLYIGRTISNNVSFSESSSLSEIKFGPYVTKIPSFYGSNKLVSVYIPDNVIELSGETFCNCLGLKTVFVGNGISKIPIRFLQNCTALENVFLGNNISEICYAAFNDCEKIDQSLYSFR